MPLTFDQCVEKIKDENRVLVLGTPRYKGNSDDYCDSLDATIIQCLGLQLPLVLARVPPVTLVELARALILDEAIKYPNATHCMMIDQDMGWTPEDLIRMWASDRDLVAGVGRRKGALGSESPSGYAVKFLMAPGVVRKPFLQPHEFLFPVDKEEGLMEVEGVGAAFLRLSLVGIQKMIAGHPELIGRVAMSTPSGTVERLLLPMLFMTGIFDGDFEAEDYSYCHRWRDLGEKVWVDPTIKLRHWGEKCWEGALIEGFKLKPTEAPDVVTS